MAQEITRYRVGSRDNCPRCGRYTKFIPVLTQQPVQGWSPLPHDWSFIFACDSEAEKLTLFPSQCTLCQALILCVRFTKQRVSPDDEHMVWPPHSERPVPEEVTEDVTAEAIASTYKRASRLLHVDAVASAAFARTCLEKILDHENVPLKRNLEERIEAFLASHSLPSAFADNIRRIRTMGNFIHLNESWATGNIVEISQEEAEFALNIMVSLFDELWVQPKRYAEIAKGFDGKVKEIERQGK